MFKFMAILIYLSSVVALLVTGGIVSSVLALYPPTHLSSFGPVMPALSQIHAGWLPAVQAATWAIAAVCAAIGLLVWRSRQPTSAKLQVAVVIGAINYFLAMFFATTLLVAYFYLPKVANAA